MLIPTHRVLVATVLLAAVLLSACASPARLEAAPAPPAEFQARTGLSVPKAFPIASGRVFFRRLPAVPFLPPAARAVLSRCAAAAAMPNLLPPDSLAPRAAMPSYPLRGPAPAPLPNTCSPPTVPVGNR